jgi:hypothetical protein
MIGVNGSPEMTEWAANELRAIGLQVSVAIEQELVTKAKCSVEVVRSETD